MSKLQVPSPKPQVPRNSRCCISWDLGLGIWNLGLAWFLVIILPEHSLSQTKNVELQEGYLENGYNYNNLLYPNNPSPFISTYLQGEQRIDMWEVPLRIKMGITTLPSGFSGKGFYPNQIQLMYNQEEFKKNLQQKYVGLLEKKAEQEFLKQQEKARYEQAEKEITPWLTEYDSVKTIRSIDSVKTLLEKRKDKTDSLTNLLEQLENRKAGFEDLRNKKQEYEKIQQSILINDSLLQEYQLSKSGIIDKKKYQQALQLNKFQNAALSVKALQFGRFSWMSRAVSASSTVDGVKIDLVPRKFLLGITAGRLYPIFYYNQIGGAQGESSRYVLGGYTGFSLSKQQIKYHYYYMYGNSLSGEKENNVVTGIEYEGKFSRRAKMNLILFGSETNQEKYKGDVYQINGIPIQYDNSFQNTFQNIVLQKKSLYFQTGYTLNIQYIYSGLLMKRDEWQVKYEMVSPFYQSFALPFVFRDQQNVSVKNIQRLLKNKIEIHTSYIYGEDNISKLRTITSFWNMSGIGIRILPINNLNLFGEYRYIQRASFTYYTQHFFNGNILFTQKGEIKLQHSLQGYGFIHAVSGGGNLNYQQLWELSKKVSLNVGGGYFNSGSSEGVQMNLFPQLAIGNGNIGLGYTLLVNDRNEKHQRGDIRFAYRLFKAVDLSGELGYGRADRFLNGYSDISSFNQQEFWQGIIRIRYLWEVHKN